MIFPLLPFWRYTPWGWLAAALWNVCELLRVSAPFAPTLFGLIVDAKGRRK